MVCQSYLPWVQRGSLMHPIVFRQCTRFKSRQGENWKKWPKSHFFLFDTYSREQRRHRSRRTVRRTQETQKKKGEKEACPPRTFLHWWRSWGGWTKSQTPHTRLLCLSRGWRRWRWWWWRRGAPEQKQKEKAEEETSQREAALAGPGASGLCSGVHLSERRRWGGGGGGGKERRRGVKVPQEHHGDLCVRRWAFGWIVIVGWTILVKINLLLYRSDNDWHWYIQQNMTMKMINRLPCHQS